MELEKRQLNLKQRKSYKWQLLTKATCNAERYDKFQVYSN